MKELPESMQRKSVLLAKAMRWDISGSGEYFRKSATSTWSWQYDLYKPRLMALVWEVLNWATETKLIIFDSWWMGFISAGAMMPPDVFVENLLDKILQLAIEKGLVEMEVEK